MIILILSTKRRQIFITNKENLQNNLSRGKMSLHKITLEKLIIKERKNFYKIL